MAKKRTAEEKHERKKKRWARLDKKNTVLKHEMNTQDSDWLAAARLRETVDAKGAGAKAAQKKLKEMEEDPLIKPRGI